MIKILHILALFGVKNANFFIDFFSENILKIIKSVPGHKIVLHIFNIQVVFTKTFRSHWRQANNFLPSVGGSRETKQTG
jgi:hypothetical protein